MQLPKYLFSTSVRSYLLATDLKSLTLPGTKSKSFSQSYKNHNYISLIYLNSIINHFKTISTQVQSSISIPLHVLTITITAPHNNQQIQARKKWPAPILLEIYCVYMNRESNLVFRCRLTWGKHPLRNDTLRLQKK